jgi:hypothetical protein
MQRNISWGYTLNNNELASNYYICYFNLISLKDTEFDLSFELF